MITVFKAEGWQAIGRLVEILVIWKQSSKVPLPPLNWDFTGHRSRPKKKFYGCFLGPRGGVKRP